MLEITTITLAASAIAIVIVALAAHYIYTKKYSSSDVQTPQKEIILFTNIGASLTYQNIVRATEHFNTKNLIEGLGDTYKAEVSPGVTVAVKRVDCVKKFRAEIKSLGWARHRNLVTLIGYHVSDAEMFLVYDHLGGGSLEKLIQERCARNVCWKVIHEIALGVARALAYLHDSCKEGRIIHGDVKPSNILLDSDLNACLYGFDVSRIIDNEEPERVSEKVDVCGYGVVLLELISDKRAVDGVVAWACLLLRDGRADEVFTSGLWDSGPRDDLVEVLSLAVECTVESSSDRPSMKRVVQRLKQLQGPKNPA